MWKTNSKKNNTHPIFWSEFFIMFSFLERTPFWRPFLQLFFKGFLPCRCPLGKRIVAQLKTASLTETHNCVHESYQLRFLLYAIINASVINVKHTNTSLTLYPVWAVGFVAVLRIFQTRPSSGTPRRLSLIPVKQDNPSTQFNSRN